MTVPALTPTLDDMASRLLIEQRRLRVADAGGSIARSGQPLWTVAPLNSAIEGRAAVRKLEAEIAEFHRVGALVWHAEVIEYIQAEQGRIRSAESALLDAIDLRYFSDQGLGEGAVAKYLAGRKDLEVLRGWSGRYLDECGLPRIRPAWAQPWGEPLRGASSRVLSRLDVANIAVEWVRHLGDFGAIRSHETTDSLGAPIFVNPMSAALEGGAPHG